MRIISAVFGVAAITLFAVTAVYAPNICLLSVGLFMLASAFIPDRRAQYTALFSLGSRRERLTAPLEVKTFAVSENTPLSAMCGVLDPDRFSEFVVLAEPSLDVRGKVAEHELVAAVKSRGYDIKAKDIITP